MGERRVRFILTNVHRHFVVTLWPPNNDASSINGHHLLFIHFALL